MDPGKFTYVRKILDKYSPINPPELLDVFKLLVFSWLEILAKIQSDSIETVISKNLKKESHELVLDFILYFLYTMYIKTGGSR